jgi:ferredoxin
MKVEINDRCILCGACSSINSDVFEMHDSSVSVNQQMAKMFQDDCRVAAEACPVDAIEIFD